MSLSDFFNYGEMFIVICNIGLAFYYKVLSYRFKKQHGQWMPSLRAKVIVDGMLGIEMLYACALSAGSSEAIGGIESPSEFLYIIAEYMKSIFFTTIICWITSVAKEDMKNFLKKNSSLEK